MLDNVHLSIPRARVLKMPPELQKDLGYHRSTCRSDGCAQDPLKYLRRLEKVGGEGVAHLLGLEAKV